MSQAVQVEASVQVVHPDGQVVHEADPAIEKAFEGQETHEADPPAENSLAAHWLHEFPLRP